MRTLSMVLVMTALASPAVAQTATPVNDDAAGQVVASDSGDTTTEFKFGSADAIHKWMAAAGDTATSSFLTVIESDIDLAQQPAAEKPPLPAHTGIKALVFETASDFGMFPRRESTWIILAIGGAAALATHPADDDVNGRLAASDAADRFFVLGKYLGGATQASAAVGLYLVGRYLLPHAEGEPRTNKVSHLGFDLLRALMLAQGVTTGIKVTVRRDRPTGECCSFPSGHASATFATASVLERHLGYRASWPMFLIATYVATSRLHDNRHFLSDVVFGASVGMASGWTVVGRHGRSNYALVPAPVPGGVMVMLTRH